MKILAAYKYVVDRAARIQASHDGTGVVSEDVKLLSNPTDEAASSEVSNAAPVEALSIRMRRSLPSAAKNASSGRGAGSKGSFETICQSVSKLEAGA